MFDFIWNTITGWGDSLWLMFERSFITDDRWRMWLGGLENTLIITFFALIIGLVFGFLLALVRVLHDASPKPPIPLQIVNRILIIYRSFIRGTPMLVQLFIFNFAILVSTRNALLVAIVAFGVNSSAYASEVFRGGILSVDKGQMEAGRSLGLNYRQTMFKIILPQAIKNSLPALGNEVITVLKETSLAGQVALIDVTRAAQLIRGLTFDPSPLFFVAGVYWLLVLFIEFLFGKFERRMRRSDSR